MEPSPSPEHSSKKRISTGSESGERSSFMDEDVVEIPPPPSFADLKTSKQKQKEKQKQVIFHEVIDVDNDEDHDLMIIEDNVVRNSTGKSSVDSYVSGLDADRADIVNLSKGVGSSRSHNLFAGDESDHDVSILNDLHGDLNHNEVIIDDECALLQAHFDSIDVPPGVEAAIPWWPTSEDSKNHGASASGMAFLPAHFDSIDVPPGVETAIPWWPTSEDSKNHGASASSMAFLPPNSFTNVGTSNVDGSQSSQTHKESSQSSTNFAKPKRKPRASSFGGKPYGSIWQPTSLYVPQGSDIWSGHLPYAVVQPSWLPYPSVSPAGNPLSSGTSIPPKFSYGANFPPNEWNVLGADKPLPFPASIPAHHNFNDTLTGGFGNFHDPSVVLDQGIAAEISVPSDLASSHQQDNIEVLIVKTLESFKKFDTVQDHSDHFYSNKIKKQSQSSKDWVKKIQEEWRILENDLPDTIFVRVYETRMDLLRAVIIGADGTPYHDGIFFFDVHFPPSYPNVPPLVYYRSGGLRLNPNLYNCGKVCLSLLNTWSGSENEKWVPGLSTTLQVLVSIQGLILNAKPYFNEPGCVAMQGSPAGEKHSEEYNENTFLLSLKTMLYSMRRPPKHFEDFVFAHFYNHAHDILIACKAYLDGAQIGTLVKGGIQDVDVGAKSCSSTFKMHLPVYINNLVEAFTKYGVQGCEKYAVPLPAKNDNNPVAADSMAMPSSSSHRASSSSSFRKRLASKFRSYK